MRPEHSKPAIARRLVATREALNEGDQQKFAKGAKLKQNSYNQYESAKRLISLKAAIKLCDAYHLTLDWIYRGEPYSLPYDLANKLRDMGELDLDTARPSSRKAEDAREAPEQQQARQFLIVS